MEKYYYIYGNEQYKRVLVEINKRYSASNYVVAKTMMVNNGFYFVMGNGNSGNRIKMW
jgi:hypothetical protein